MQAHLEQNQIKLIAKEGSLWAPFAGIVDELQREWAEGKDTLLFKRYDAGDVDTIKWPRFNADHLRSALYDAREMGQIPDESIVLLPNGKPFNIDL